MNRKQRRAAAKPESTSDRRANAAPSTAGAELFEAGVKHHQAGRLAEAEAFYRRVLAILPNDPEAMHLLGVKASQIGQHDLALEWIGAAIERSGSNPTFCFSLGVALIALSRWDEAIATNDRAIALMPDYAEAHNNRGVALRGRGDLDEAIAAYRQAIALKPDYSEPQANMAEAHSTLGHDLNAKGQFEAAIAACRRAIAIKPDQVGAYLNLGNALGAQGQLKAAITAYRSAITIKPDYAEAHSNLLLNLNYDEKLSPGELFAAHRASGAGFDRPSTWPHSYANSRDTERRLRVGYVSADFREHSVAYFLEPLLKAHDRRVVEIICYAEVERPDAVTARLRGLADRWLATVGLSDAALAEQIQRDEIDILVDLAGHTAKNRLRVFAQKPAPVQVTWLGYPNTTGMDAIDYRLVDQITDPVGASDTQASETLIRLNGGFLCYGGIADAPAPTRPPCLATGTVTFGSFNNTAKISPATLDAWAALLLRMPQARLLLKGKQFADDAGRERLLARLRDRGVAIDQIEIMAQLPDLFDHFRAYDRMDIALDTFPYNGTTTTCEALWMGVPVVTLRGDRHAARVGASLLSQAGLTDLVANSVADYVEIAVTLAENTARLDTLRRTLRPALSKSPLCDERSFARKIEQAYRDMWHRWCETPTVSDRPYVETPIVRSDSLPIKLRDGSIVAAPPTLSTITTYVLLEQEDWFEKEIHFVRRFLKRGMIAIDIGANLGIYGLSMARLVAPDGRVFCYEPGSEARARLEEGRALNDLHNVEIRNAALSDGERDGHLSLDASTELRALDPSGSGELVHITSLDLESAAHNWAKVDFVKIDAEGEEERILAGGASFFAAHSPLVMFEVKAGDKPNEGLLKRFESIGYRLFRQLGSEPILVPHDAAWPVDEYELNLFAAKPDRVRDLSEQNLLVDALPAWSPSEEERKNAALHWRQQKFSGFFDVFATGHFSPDRDYQNALVAYASWRAQEQPVARRCAALAFALQSVRAACQSACTAERASTLARIAWEWGARGESVGTLRQLMQWLETRPVGLSEPFWPASPRFDDIAPGDTVANWFLAATLEQLERTYKFSSFFGGTSPAIAWLCDSAFSGVEMERRRTLAAARAALQPKVPERLLTVAPDHLNADLWRSGLVQGTMVGD